MPTAQASTPPFGATTTLGGGGGGGGGLSNEADQVVLYDDGNDTFFLRRYVKDDVGGGVSKVDTELDGTTAYVVSAEANVTQPPIQAVGGPNVVVTYTNVTTDTTTNIAAGALAVQYYVQAGTVTVEGATVPAGVGITHEIPGMTTDALAFVTSGGSADLLIIEERAA